MSTSPPLRILVLTTHRVANTVGGELLLHRHIHRSPATWRFELHHLDGTALRRRPWFERARRRHRRMERLLNAWDAWSGASLEPAGFGRLVRAAQPDVLYTVADGAVAMRVWQLSRRSGIPFVAQLNDWYPGGRDVSHRLEDRLRCRFQEMLRQSAVALCFSEEIRAAAGSPPNARVLYPIPEEPPTAPAGPVLPHALFAGRFDHFLGTEMLALLRAARARGQADRLRIIGPDEHWDAETRGLVAGTSIYGGLLKGPAFHAALQSALVLLVLAPFGPERAHIAHYSFPSKIPEYCHHHRPILVWGPEDSSSVQWARRTGAAAVVSSPDPGVVLDEVDRLAREPGIAERRAGAARREADTVFNPLALQSIFEQALREAAHRRARPGSQ